MVLAAIPFGSFASYGAETKKLTITHINAQPTVTNTAIIISGEYHSKLGELGTFAWWRAAIFDWDEEAGVYKVINVISNYNNYDKSNFEIPEKGFAYGLCVANDGNKNDPVTNSFNYIPNLKVGDTAYLYNTDLSNAVIQNNGKNFYDADYVSDSFIKIGEPEEDLIPYNPNEAYLLGFNIVPDTIDEVVFREETSIIMTDNSGRYVDYENGKSFDWWYTFVSEWDDTEGCYVVASVSKVANYETPKQPIIPENGFAFIDHTTNKASIESLKVGSKLWLYDIDLKNSVLGENPLIRVNLPDENRTAYTPNLTNKRLATPVINEANNNNIKTTVSGINITWDAVEGASGYVLAINDSNKVPDGTMKVLPTVVTENSYTVPASILSLSENYTLWIYAIGENKETSMMGKYSLTCISDTAMNSSLRDKTVVAFGDSLTAITGWVKALGGYIGTDVINAGVGGNNTNTARARFEADVLSHNPDLTLICFGMNDQAKIISSGKPNVSLETYTANLEYFAEELQKIGSDVIFITPNPVNKKTYTSSYGMDYANGYMNEFCDAMRRVALKYNCTLIDINYECEFENLFDMLTNDGIHLDPYGQTRYTELISDHLLAVYDGIDKAELTVNEIDEKGTVLESKTYVGKEGAHRVIPISEREDYTLLTKSGKTTLENGKVFEIKYVEIAPEMKEGVNYDIDEKNSVLYAAHNTTANEFLQNFQGEGVFLRNADDTEDVTGDTLIITGMRVKYRLKNYKLIITGDLDNDGIISKSDSDIIVNYLLGKAPEPDSLADINSDGVINLADALLIIRKASGINGKYFN